MTPLLGCVPSCFLFFALGVAGLLTYLASGGGSEEPGETPAPRPPYWVAPVTLLVVVVFLLLLSLVTDG